MQTFLPHQSFKFSAEVLDNKRLGKQRVENLQILKAIILPEYGWKNHPAVKMWKGYILAFSRYHNAICDEWTGRGFKDTCKEKFQKLLETPGWYSYGGNPSWIGDEEFHKSHKSNLTRKKPEHYSKFWNVPNDIDYVWPTNEQR